MSLIHFFFPKTIHLPDTDFNQNISVTLWSTEEPTLIANGLIQSGSIMKSIWSKGVRLLVPKKFKPKKILLLGLGTGSNARLVRKLYPDSRITAVEIDPGMVEIAKKYCGLNKITDLKVIDADAFDYVHSLHEEFDLTLVDCFEGKYIPKKLEQLSFFTDLKSHSRYVLINRLYHAEHIADTLAFMSSLATKLPFIKIHTRTNLIISLV